MVDPIDQVRALVAECLALRMYVNLVAYLFGWPEAQAEARSQESRLSQLRDIRHLLDDPERCKSYASETNLDRLVEELKHERDAAAENRAWWKQNPIPIHCDDATLASFAKRVKTGPLVVLTKSQIEENFDFSRIDHFWEWIPEYTRCMFAFGMYWSNPDSDLFRSMAFFHDEAVRASQGVESALSEMAKARDHRSIFFRGLQMKKMYASQTIVNACLLVEAFLNGLASVAVTKLAGSLSKAELLFLCELREKNGKEETKYVNTQKKLVEWVKLMSPRKAGLDPGRNPHQGYIKIEELRHSIVHLSVSKIGFYESIGHEEASCAADL